MKIEYRDGLLFTSITISFQGRSKVIDDIVIDTGASHTLISQDIVDDIGIRVSKDDYVVTSYGIGGKEFAFTKEIDSVEVDGFRIEQWPVDFTSFKHDNINGLLGLDILMRAKFYIDLKHLEMKSAIVIADFCFITNLV